MQLAHVSILFCRPVSATACSKFYSGYSPSFACFPSDIICLEPFLLNISDDSAFSSVSPRNRSRALTVDAVFSHGRDNTLRIWQLRATDESSYSTLLPADSPSAHRPKPWLLHALPVNTLNFCAFSMCYERPAVNILQSDGMESDRARAPSTRVSESILVAVPSRDDKKIEVYQFPDEKLVSIVPRVQTTDTGEDAAVIRSPRPIRSYSEVNTARSGCSSTFHISSN